MSTASAQPSSQPSVQAKPSPSSSTQQTQRAQWIDIARTLAMFFIMWLHTRNAPSAIHGAVDGGIGLFFLFAGYFLPREAGRCAQRALEQGRAWIFWMVLPSLLYIAGGMQWEWQRGLGWGVGAYNAPLWFLRNLVIFQLLMAGLMALRLLPKHAALLTISLAGLGYITQWPEHTVLRFDWMFALALGFTLRAIKLQTIYDYLQRNYRLILPLCVLLILQPKLLEIFAREADLKYYLPMAPMRAMSYTCFFLLLAIGVEKYLPRAAKHLALIGRCTMFIFVSHSLLYGAIIYIEHCFLGGTQLDGPWTPAIAMLILTPLCLWLQQRYPRGMAWVGCPAPKKP